MPLYGYTFGLLGVASAAVATRGGAWVLFGWPAVAFLLVTVAYALRKPGLIGKRGDGSFAIWRRLFLLPFVAVSEGIWHLYAALSDEAAYDEVAPKLWVGRWPGARALPEGVDVVVDVTAELPAHTNLTGSKRYLCLPALDATVPDEEAFVRTVRELAPETGGVFVHCAFGHGRSAMVAAALLVARGVEADVDAAERRMQRARPRIALKGAQRAYVERFTKRMASPRP